MWTAFYRDEGINKRLTNQQPIDGTISDGEWSQTPSSTGASKCITLKADGLAEKSKSAKKDYACWRPLRKGMV